MIVCPVCEHPQAQSFECEVCGKQLVPSRVVAAASAPIEGLESTGYEEDGASVPDVVLPDLEPTRNEAVPAAGAEALFDLEPLRAPVIQVDVQMIPDLEVHRLSGPSPDERTAAPVGPVTCRYCRNIQSEGMLCDRCGMRLPRLARAVASSGGPGAPSGQEAPTVKHGCGVRTLAGQPCSSCGVFVPLPT